MSELFNDITALRTQAVESHNLKDAKGIKATLDTSCTFKQIESIDGECGKLSNFEERPNYDRGSKSFDGCGRKYQRCATVFTILQLEI